jgi:hypothetical protein
MTTAVGGWFQAFVRGATYGTAFVSEDGVPDKLRPVGHRSAMKPGKSCLENCHRQVPPWDGLEWLWKAIRSQLKASDHHAIISGFPAFPAGVATSFMPFVSLRVAGDGALRVVCSTSERP